MRDGTRTLDHLSLAHSMQWPRLARPCRRLVLTSSDMLVSRGISLYCLDKEGRIERVSTGLGRSMWRRGAARHRGHCLHAYRRGMARSFLTHWHAHRICSPSALTRCSPTQVYDNPEHPVKLSTTSLTLMAPLLRNLTGPVLSFMDQLSGAARSWPLPGSDGGLGAVGGTSGGWGANGARTSSGGGAVSSISASNGAVASLGQQLPLHADTPPAALAAPGSPAAALTLVNGVSAANSDDRAAEKPAAAPAPAESASAAPSSSSSASTPAEQPAAEPPVAAAAPPPAPPAAPRTVDLSGLWARDDSRSDAAGLERSLDVLRLSGLQKVTARLIEGIEVKQTPQAFDVSFLTIVPFFKVC